MVEGTETDAATNNVGTPLPRDTSMMFVECTECTTSSYDSIAL